MDLSDHPRIEIDPQRMSGAPVIKDTRMPVSTLVRYVADGFTVEQLLGPDYFPQLQADDVRAALRFAAEVADAPMLQAAE